MMQTNESTHKRAGLSAGIFAHAKLAPGGHDEIAKIAGESFVLHVFEETSLTDYACVRSAYSKAGLDMPIKNGFTPEKGGATVLFLAKTDRGINSDVDNLKKLIARQREIDYEVVLLPQAVFYGKRPGRAGPSKWYDDVFGAADKPKLLRKWFMVLSSNGGAVAQAGEAIHLKSFLEQPDVRSMNDASAARALLDLIRRDFSNLHRAVLGPPVAPREVMKEKVKKHPILVRSVEQAKKVGEQSEWQIMREVEGYLEQMMADYDVRFIRIWEKILSWVWKKFFGGIAIDYVGLERARRLAHKTPVIYVPCHKSHTDYLLVSYVLFTNHMTPPHIAAGANLNFWPLGFIFRKSGAFFLKRSFKSEGIYSAVLESYLRTLMAEGFDIEAFIEGGRSRTGKLFLPRMGLLSMMFRAFESGEATDLKFVPVSINYDRVPEEAELLGENQMRRLLKPGWRGAREILSRNNGHIHINFAAPLSLKEYLDSNRVDPEKMELEERRALYRDFAFRIIRSINEVSVSTPNAIAASALLAHNTPGVEEPHVYSDANVILKYLTHTRARLTPTLRYPDAAISEALRLNSAQNLIREIEPPAESSAPPIIEIAPEKRCILEMYKNNLLHRLYPASFVAASMLRHKDGATREDIEKDYVELSLLMKYELVYNHDRAAGSYVDEVLAFFQTEGYSAIDADEKTLRLTPAGFEIARLFSGQIENLLEAYMLGFENGLPADKDGSGKFMKKMIEVGLRAYQTGRIKRREAAATTTFKNSFDLMKHLEKTGRSELIKGETFGKYLNR